MCIRDSLIKKLKTLAIHQFLCLDPPLISITFLEYVRVILRYIAPAIYYIYVVLRYFMLRYAMLNYSILHYYRALTNSRIA